MSKAAMENLMKAMGEEGITPISLEGPNNCILCQSSYAAVSVSDSKSSKNDFGRMQSYQKKRYKLLLEYLLHKDTVHYSSEHPNEDQHRRHLLIQTLLESRETEEGVAESGTLYQLCPMCERKADEVMKLHLELEVVQMKLVDKISCLTDAVITNSMCGSNEVAKNRMQEMQMWLQQDQDNGDEGIMSEVGRLRNYMDTLMKFQTLIFEGGSKPKSVPCLYLQKCMPISSFSEDERDVVNWSFIKTSTKILPTTSITLDSMSVSNCEQLSSHATMSSDSDGVDDNPSSTVIREVSRVSRRSRLSRVCQKTFRSLDKLKKQKATHEREELSDVDYLSEPEDASNIEISDEYADSNDDESEEFQPTARSNASNTSSDSDEALTSDKNKDEQLNQKMGGMPPPPKVMKLLSSGSADFRIPRSSINPDTGMHKCNVCPLEFKTRESAGTHYHTVHSVKYECILCGMDFPRRGIYQKHYRTTHMDLKLKCDICNKMFATNYDLKKHQMSHIKKKRVASARRIQPKSAKGSPRISVNPDTGRFHCPLCPKDFRSYEGFWLHHRSIHLEVKHDCLECGKQFASKTSLTRHHEKVHLNVKTKRHECPVCKKSLSSKQSLKLHQRSVCGSDMKRAHVVVDGKFECSVCKKSFTQKGNLTVHLRITSPSCGTAMGLNTSNPHQKPICDLCGKELSTFSNLKAHLRDVHERKRQFPCEHCDKIFNRERDRSNHTQAIHLGIRFTCEVCKKSFSQKGLLGSHQLRTACGTALGRNQEPVPMNVCHECGKEFETKFSLKAHLKLVHVTERKYPCEVCGKLFKTPSCVLIHNRVVHRGIKQLQKPRKKKLDPSPNEIMVKSEGVLLGCD